MKTPVTYYGGKQRMIPFILPLIPAHKKYVEAFAGGAAVFFAKRPSAVEILNDKNGNVANFYRVMKTDFNRLTSAIEATLHCEHTYKEARKIYRNPGDFTPLRRAWAFWVGSAMSFGGMLFTSFQIACNSADKGNPGRSTQNKKNYFRRTAGRLDGTMILEKDALSVLRKFNQVDTFAYLDPPYIGVNQGHYKGYSEQDFINLLDTCSSFKGKFLLSSYESDILKEYTERERWTTKRIDQRLGVKGNKQRKIEVLTSNYTLMPTLFN